MDAFIQAAGRLNTVQAVAAYGSALPMQEQAQKFPEPGEAHVWSARLNSTPNQYEVFFSTLSSDERKRAERFVFERDSKRYIIARGILRELLGNYLDVKPDQVCFSYGKYGKPHLAESRAGSGLEFNLSHTADSAVYAFANRTQIGIDIEPLSNGLAWRQLAPIVFSEKEQAELAMIPEAEQAGAFLRGWTRKEALVKACGFGLSLNLNTFDVPLGTARKPSAVQLPAIPPKSEGKRKQANVWWLYPIELNTDYAAALAVKEAPLRVIAKRWGDWSTRVNPAVTGTHQFEEAVPPARLARHSL
ncbi:MAG: 4'-phosphopantetheinyl transferase [Methylobacter sp.]|nr:MAG: 4'-phosphopantetheinyl transferase [Methylobacter sp.]PPD17414.1 MAG: 4'-phosphopantetheinyl transferase [Methylobacter sp.]PPD36100.1 MAG: 4'-phosphopantetheinyl transferase [Methylomonas sp.]